MGKNGCFLSSSLVSSTLGGVVEEDKNANRAKQKASVSSFPLSCLLITLAFVLRLDLQLWGG